MIIKLTKRLLTLVLVVTLVFSSRIAVAAADNHFSFTKAISPANHPGIIQAQTFSDHDLTPQERQEIQAVRQRRNKEIAKILTSSQRQELDRQLHSSKNLDKSLSAVNLNSEQQKLIKAIEEVANLKIKSIISRHEVVQTKK
ncbi:MAG TPA: hypothetical protein VK203_24265 [Nostocaceae cyanobacterium]|nr:hypothetical protein [Nostocaceae cyanobacterium]